MKKSGKENLLLVLICVVFFVVAYWLGPGDREEFSLGPIMARLVNLVVAVTFSLVMTLLFKNISKLIASKLSGREEVPWGE
jgi:hypothetical protein